MKNPIFFAAAFACGCLFTSFILSIGSPAEDNAIEPDYKIELLNDGDVLIESEDTIYKCKLDEIPQTIEKDNL